MQITKTYRKLILPAPAILVESYVIHYVVTAAMNMASARPQCNSRSRIRF
jgi:hypothetical protein